MRLYAGTSKNFIEDTVRNQIGEKLHRAFFDYYRYNPSDSEIHSWNNSLIRVKDVLQHADLTDHGVLLEYQLPLSSKRLDCMVCGRNNSGQDNAVIVELKQWSKCFEAIGENELSTVLGGGYKDVLHPSAQVSFYSQYLQDTHTAFYEGEQPVQLHSCAYLHNYAPEANDILFASKFSYFLKNSPVYTADDFDSICEFLSKRLVQGNGMEVLRRVEESKYRPSKKLMEHVAGVIDGHSDYVLLDEQRLAFDKIMGIVQHGFHKRQKYVVIVRGGPGTGKSVIAINLMADLLRKEYNAHYATGSRAFTETLRNVIGRRGSVQFKYFNSYAGAQADEVDVLICDESHRLRKTSNSRFTKKVHRSDLAQIQEILQVARVCVFFIDDDQVVRPEEIGSSSYIIEAGKELKASIDEFTLDIQFRCAGSQAFIAWIENTLGIHRTANVLWTAKEEAFDFRIFPSAQKLESAIRERAAQGYSARLTAGFCWDWSIARPDGSLVEDIVIDDFRRPWNARPEARHLARGIPKATLWAHDPGGMKQVGCVYTAQGFEFDYVGVIFGKDLRYSFDSQNWIGDPSCSADPVVKKSKNAFIDLVKNTYRVLLSRGMKGCYVYFQDKETEQFVKSRIDLSSMQNDIDATPEAQSLPFKAVILPFRRLPHAEARPYENCVPLYDLKIAASYFSDEQQVADTEWVALPDVFRPQQGLFVAQVVGESMNRRIPNGAWCLFRLDPVGTRQGKVVLVQHRDITDSDMGGHYTIKVYESKKKVLSDGTWRHTSIVLKPDTTASGHEPIILSEEQSNDLKVIAELIAVLG